MKSWFTALLPRSIVSASLARRFKALPGAFRTRARSLSGAAMGRLDPLRGAWALRTVALMLVGFAATGVGLRAQNVSTFVGSGAGLDGPKGLAFDSSGNLYIANANANTVSKVTPGGVFTTFVPWYLSNPYGLAFDLSGTNLYVANKVTGLVSQVTPPGALSTFAEGFAIPTGLAFDTSGNLYVANQSLGTVSKVTPGGVVSPSPFVTLGLDGLQGLAFDSSGNLYVADYDTNTVIKVTTGGDKLAFASGFDKPTGLAFDASGNLYVANSGANPGEGTVSKVTTGGVVTTFASGFSYPWGLAFDTAGDLYVANSGAKTVSKIVFTPIVISPTSASVASTAATLGGNVTSDAGLTITARGVVYSVTATNGNPQIGGSGVANVIGTGTTGVFTVSATGLTAGTGYSYAAYATNSRGTTYSPVGTFTTLPLPTVSSVSPSAGPTAGGTSVVITGTNFTNVTAVKFGTAAATGYTVNSATQITATSPSASAGTVDITVTTVSGTSATSAAAEFTFVPPNSAPTDISLSPSSVNENVATNTIVGALSTTDPDAGNTFTYTLVAGIGSADNASFNIDGSNLRITGSPDYEAKSSYAIRLRSTDQGSLWHEKAFTITINDVNESPTMTTVSALAGGAEDTPFTVTYGQLLAAANAADPEGATLSFRVEGVSTGTLTKNGTSVTADETLLGTGESLVWTPAPNVYGALNAFTVRVWDGSLVSATAVQVSVSVAPVAETPSVTHATTVEDEQTGSGLVITTNAPDGGEVTHFKITAITNGRLYQTDGTTEITDGSFITIAEGGAGLKFTPALNKNTAAGDSFTFNVQAATNAMGGGLSPAATATITVTSVNDAPTNLALSTNSIRRSAAANTTIGTLSTTDVDTGDTFTYTLVSGTGDTDNASFNISGATLRATNPQALIGGARSVRVRSTDAGGLSFEKVLSITVVDDLLVVGSNADSGPGSLRQVIADLPVGGVISFALPSGRETIAVASYLLVDKSLTIDGRNTAGSGTPVTVQVTTPGASPWQVVSIELTDDDTVTLQNLVLRGGNVSGHAVPYGGVVLSEGGTLNLTDVTVRDGVAVAGGGLFTASATRAIGCTFTGNAAVGVTGSVGGGGLYVATGSTLLLLNGTIAGNAAQTDAVFSRGGGAYFEGSASIINSTITGNSVRGMAPAREGGGVYNQSGLVNVVNSIVAGNQTASSADDIATAPTGITNTYYSWVGTVSGQAIGTQPTAPNQTTAYSADQLSALGNFGGATQTVRVNAGAPAIGHGTFVYEEGGYWFLATDGMYHRLDAYATAVAMEPTGMIGTDQRGIARTSPPTIGAYQVGLNVAGTITRAGGVAFSGVTVRDGSRAGTTDASGSFTLRDVPSGTYTLTPSYPGYTFTPASRSVTVSGADINGADFVAAPVPVEKDAQSITFAPLADVTLGQTVSLSASASSRLPVSFSVVSGPATVSGSTLTTTGVGLVTVRATQAGNGSYNAAAPVERSFRVTVGAPPVVDTPTSVPAPAPGGAATLTVPQTNPNLTYQWQRNGETLAGATGATLTLTNVQPPAAGLYTYTATTAAGAGGTSEPVIVGVATTEKVTGTGTQVGADIQHPNGNIYDQLLLEGAGATFTAEPAQVTRMSYVDLSGDIVQVEFSGAGSLSLVMDDAGTPAPAANYNQPGVNYVRGHVGIVITGADETTNVAVFSVGRITAVNQALFREEVAYDGVANIAFIAIQSTNGKFGGVRTGNVEYYAQSGFTGLYAPGVAFSGPVNIGDIQAFDNAQPLLVVGSAPNARIAGGNLAQPNGQPIRVAGLTQLTLAPGQTSQGDALPAQTNQGVLQQDGVDVTDLIVAAP